MGTAVGGTEDKNLEAAKRSAIIRSAHTGDLYYVIQIGDTYKAVSCRDYYLNYWHYEAIYQVSIEK